MLTVKVNEIERQNLISISDFSIADNINEKINSCSFSLLKHAGQTYEPVAGDLIEVLDEGTTIFKGVILTVEKEVEASLGVRLSIFCKDLSHFLDRSLVLERFSDMTAGEIITAIIEKYAVVFNTTNVDCDITIQAITFDRQTVSECIQRLAEATNYSWYVDYSYGVHFFASDAEEAPFDLTATSDNYEYNTLKFSDDLSQLRNRITIRGGEEEGNETTETFIASADSDERKVYRLAHKFVQIPTVLVDSTPQAVGVDFLDEEADFDCFWNFNEKYVRFKTASSPGSGDTVEITGIPLFPVIVTRSETDSIDTYGIYEFFEENKNITSRDQALDYALAKLTAYKNTIKEGSFQTRTAGLKSGQIININIPAIGVNEDFVIQTVRISMVNPDSFTYNVELATLRTVGVIKVLQELLRKRDITQENDEVLLSFSTLADQITATTALISIASQTSAAYKWEANSGGPAYSPPMKWNFFTWRA